MSKDQKKTKQLSVENVEKLKNACKMLNEVRTGIHYWKLDQIWPTNLYIQIIEKVIDTINYVIFEEDVTNSVSRGNINDK